MSASWRRWRLLLPLAALMVALPGVELGLRLALPTLPSLRGLDDASYAFKARELPDDTPALEPWDLPSCLDRALLEPVENVESDPVVPGSLRMLVLGDSVARGHGASRGAGVARGVAGLLGERLQRPVSLQNAAVPGGGVCEQALAGHLAVRARAPDLLLWILFADDLELRRAFSARGRVVAWPGTTSPPGARRSYLVNALWYTSLIWREGRQVQPRMLEPDLLGRLVEGLLLRPELAGRPALLVLVAPSGLGSCPPNPPVDSACGRFETQGALIARALQGQPAPFLDLRTLWEGGPSRVALSEREAEKQGGLGVHPDDEGHRMLAEAIARRLVGGMGG